MKIALVGNQNAGKTTLFNALTGNNQKVGNWPGVTIERKEGIIKNSDIIVVDLPGIYSLSPYSPEEEVSRSFVLNNNPDLVINIVDATQIERSLYLTTQILETGRDVVIALNMTDVLEKEKDIMREQLLNEGKPADKIDNILVIKDQNNMQSLREYLKAKLHNNQFTLVEEVVERPRETVLYTDKQKFEKMSSDNPNIVTIKNSLNLQID